MITYLLGLKWLILGVLLAGGVTTASYFWLKKRASEAKYTQAVKTEQESWVDCITKAKSQDAVELCQYKIGEGK